MKTVTKNKSKSARRVKGVQLPVGVRKVVKSEVRNIAGRGENGKFTKGEATLFQTVENASGVDAVLEGAVQFNGRVVIRNRSSQIGRIRRKREGQMNNLSRKIGKAQSGSESSKTISGDSLMAMAE